jgi:hypothetical protein
MARPAAMGVYENVGGFSVFVNPGNLFFSHDSQQVFSEYSLGMTSKEK